MNEFQLCCDNVKWEDFDKYVSGLLCEFVDMDIQIVIKLE